MPLKPHPLNQGFSWPERPSDGLAFLTSEQILAWNAEGWLHLREVWNPKALAPMIEAIDVEEAKETSAALVMEEFDDIHYDRGQISFTCNLVSRIESVRVFATSQIFIDLMEDLISPHVRLYWDQAVYKRPGNPQDFPWHQDNGYTFVEPQAYVTCWIPLSPATLDNGCPWVIPKLHRNGTLLHEHTKRGLEIVGIADEEKRAKSCPVEPGDMVVFSSLTPHRTGPNLSQSIRKALILQYIPDGAVHLCKGERRTLINGALNPLI